MTKFESIRQDFQKALLRFEEILKEKRIDIVRDSSIKRFEIPFDLAWKDEIYTELPSILTYFQKLALLMEKETKNNKKP